MGNLNFDATNVEPSVAFDVIPAGKYRCCITASEKKPTKTGNGEYLALTIQVVEGEHKNRFVWAILNLDNPSAKAVEIAKADLSAIMRAVGILKITDSSELHAIPFVAKIGVKKRDDTGELQNTIGDYKSIDKAKPLDVTRQAPEATGGSDDAPPWANK